MKYNDYRTTKIPWIDKLPAHWEEKNVNNLFDERREKVSDEDYPPLSVTKAGIVPQLENVAKSSANDNRKKVLVGDFVINSRSDRKGSSGISDYDGSVSLINTVMIPRLGDKLYWHYLLKSNDFVEEFYRNGKGIVADLWTTNFQSMKSIILPVPPKEEQEQIAKFLDWKISSIDKLIATKRKDIFLLYKAKQKIVSDAVTGTMLQNLGISYKAVDLPWVKEIPEHWQFSRAKKYIEYKKHINRDYGEKNVLSLTLRGVINNDSENPIGLSPGSYSTYQVFEKDDLVFKLIDLNNISTSRVGLVHEKGIMSSAYIRGVVNKVYLNPKFIYYWYKKLYYEEVYNKLGSGVRETIGQQQLFNMAIPIPPKEEQNKIVNFLDNKISIMDSLIDIKSKEIYLLEDMKKTIVSNTVTGRINVQDIKVPAYESIDLDSHDICIKEEA